MKEFILNKLRENLLSEKVETPIKKKINVFKELISDLNVKPVVGKTNTFEFSNGSSSLFFKPTQKADTIDLDLIQTKEEARGSGSAKSLLNDFINHIDNYGLTIELMVSPRDKNTKPKKLIDFYKSFGFIFQSMGGFDSDFEMIRYKKRKN